MNAAILDQDGIVQNVIVLDDLSDFPGAVLCPEHVGIGQHIDTPAPVIPEPTPVDTTPKSCSSLEFIEKFTDAEQLAIVTAAMQVPAVRLWYDKMIAATSIVFADPRLSAGMDALVAAGLITEARSLEVLPASVRSSNVTTI